jgi:hypothetical protein
VAGTHRVVTARREATKEQGGKNSDHERRDEPFAASRTTFRPSPLLQLPVPLRLNCLQVALYATVLSQSSGRAVRSGRDPPEPACDRRSPVAAHREL